MTEAVDFGFEALSDFHEFSHSLYDLPEWILQLPIYSSESPPERVLERPNVSLFATTPQCFLLIRRMRSSSTLPQASSKSKGHSVVQWRLTIKCAIQNLQGKRPQRKMRVAAEKATTVVS